MDMRLAEIGSRQPTPGSGCSRRHSPRGYALIAREIQRDRAPTVARWPASVSTSPPLLLDQPPPLADPLAIAIEKDVMVQMTRGALI